jgi:hypothetical protein
MSDVLQLPSKMDRRWRDLVLGANTTPPKLLALKFMLSRLTLAAKKDPSPTAVQKGIDELYEFFSKNPRMVEADAAALFR